MTILDKEPADVNNKKKKKKAIKKTKNKKQNLLFYKLLSFLLIVITIFNIGLIIYKDIFPIFYMIPIILVSSLIIFVISFILNRKHLRKWIKNIVSFFAILIIIFDLLMIFYGNATLKFLSTITDTGYRVQTYGVYVLDNDKTELKDLNGKKITYLNQNDDKNVRKVLATLRKEIEFEDDYVEELDKLIKMLEDSDTDAILIETSYEGIIKEEFEDAYNNLKLIKTVDIVDIVNTIESNADITKDPFIVYISGIDTSGNIASKARSDVNILLAINPKTKNILMINTPRDYYVKFHTKGKKDKLTHAGVFGVEESLMTLSDLYDANIDYYVRVNFTSFMKIVNSLDGITVNVPKSFCEQDSNRNKEKQICLNKGTQTLNGEQALALVRHRKTIGDRQRGENQMLVLKAIINKALSPKILTKYTSLLDSLQGRVVTNMKVQEMIKFAKKQIDNGSNWTFNSISADGSDARGYCEATGAGKAYVMEPNLETIEDIKKSIKNLFNGEENIIVTTKKVTS